jgi:hypothetical protein
MRIVTNCRTQDIPDGGITLEVDFPGCHDAILGEHGSQGNDW